MMRFLLAAICCWFCYGGPSCTDQRQAIPASGLSKVEQLQTESITLVKPKKEELNKTDYQLSKESLELFAWFDTLGFPDLNNRKCIRVLRSISVRSFDNVDKYNYELAFLLEENHEFKEFHLDLNTLACSETNYKMITGEPIGFVEVNVNLKDEVVSRLAALRERGKEDFSFRRIDNKVTERVELFVLARGCFGNGLNQLADELIAEAARIPDDQMEQPVGVKGLKSLLSKDIAHAMMWRHVLALGNPNVSRTDSLKRFRDFMVKYPQSQHAGRAKASAEILEKMIKEDEEHARNNKKTLDEMTTEEQVAELIYQLRDQNGCQFSQPGFCNIFNDPRDGDLFNTNVRAGGSPASKLVLLGDDALEQLIESVDDDRFTRSIGYHRNFYFSHHVIRVGECCMRIIDEIRPTERTFDIKGNPEGAKHAMKAWYLSDRRKQ